MYNLGFVVYTVASLLLAIDWMTGREGATYLIGFRIVQGIGGACLLANSAAILTDAFPANQRGLALGINNIVGIGDLRGLLARGEPGLVSATPQGVMELIASVGVEPAGKEAVIVGRSNLVGDPSSRCCSVRTRRSRCATAAHPI